MTSQVAGSTAVYYIEFDTAPPLRACLKDGQDEPIDLTGASVTISVAFAMPRGTYYTSPRDNIVQNSPVTVDPDQVANTGFVAWSPGTVIGVDALTPPGEFLYQFEVTYQDLTVQTIPPNTYLPMVIKTKVGGRANNPQP